MIIVCEWQTIQTGTRGRWRDRDPGQHLDKDGEKHGTTGRKKRHDMQDTHGNNHPVIAGVYGQEDEQVQDIQERNDTPGTQVENKWKKNPDKIQRMEDPVMGEQKDRTHPQHGCGHGHKTADEGTRRQFMMHPSYRTRGCSYRFHFLFSKK